MKNTGSSKTKNLSSLSTVLADLGSAQKIQQFLSEFLTKNEISVLSKRLSVLQLISQGDKYETIAKKLKVSSATIASYAGLTNGSGIGSALKALEVDEWAEKITKKIFFLKN